MTTGIATSLEVAKEAITVLEFYRTYYASSDAYQQRHIEVIALLRNRAETFKRVQDYGGYKFLMMFADTLAVSNRAGEYLPHPALPSA